MKKIPAHVFLQPLHGYTSQRSPSKRVRISAYRFNSIPRSQRNFDAASLQQKNTHHKNLPQLNIPPLRIPLSFSLLRAPPLRRRSNHRNLPSLPPKFPP